MSDRLVLVTGATGSHGQTGAHVVRRLREQGASVRVLARAQSARTDELSDLGAEIFIGDLLERNTLLEAVADTTHVTFTWPIAAGAVEAAANFAGAIKEAAARPRVVVTSMGPAHPRHPSHLGRRQWLAEEVLQWAGLDLRVLRIPALFYENISTLHGQSIRSQSIIRNSFGYHKVPWISGQDAALLVAEAIIAPHKFENRAIQYPPGSELLDHAEIAAILSERLGRTIAFEPVSAEAWKEELNEIAKAMPGGPVNADMARHISAVGASFSLGRTPPAAPDGAKLEELIDRPPLHFRTWLEEELARGRIV